MLVHKSSNAVDPTGVTKVTTPIMTPFLTRCLYEDEGGRDRAFLLDLDKIIFFQSSRMKGPQSKSSRDVRGASSKRGFHLDGANRRYGVRCSQQAEENWAI